MTGEGITPSFLTPLGSLPGTRQGPTSPTQGSFTPEDGGEASQDRHSPPRQQREQTTVEGKR